MLNVYTFVSVVYKNPNGLQAFRMIDQKAIDDGVHMN